MTTAKTIALDLLRGTIKNTDAVKILNLIAQYGQNVIITPNEFGDAVQAILDDALDEVGSQTWDESPIWEAIAIVSARYSVSQAHEVLSPFGRALRAVVEGWTSRQSEDQDLHKHLSDLVIWFENSPT